MLGLEQKRHRYEIALSDLLGRDIDVDEGKYEVAIRKVRNGLVGEGFETSAGSARIVSDYEDVQEWYSEG